MGRHVATLQPISDCRWSRHPLHVLDAGKTESEGRWVCVRTPGRRRPITKEECEECGFWETGEFIDPLSRR
jgi:hypothetical protein